MRPSPWLCTSECLGPLLPEKGTQEGWTLSPIPFNPWNFQNWPSVRMNKRVLSLSHGGMLASTTDLLDLQMPLPVVTQGQWSGGQPQH